MTGSSIPTDRQEPALPGRHAILKSLHGATAMVLVLCLVAATASRAGADEPAGYEIVEIETATGTHRFKTEIADTPGARERGLMFRHILPSDRAMLFDWGDDRVAAMWMRNTFIALDMIFILRSGKVESIAENTVPQSLETISSRGLVAAVLEVAAGTTKRIALKPGDRVRHRMFSGSAE